MPPPELSKYLAYLLRHNPAALDLRMDEHGWVSVEDLLAGLAREGRAVTLAELEQLVAEDAKGRYSLREGRIRANQGHSLAVQAFDPTPRTPPDRLYHGTTHAAWSRIVAGGGLSPMQRHHVHLSADLETARSVGSRRRNQELLVLEVDAAGMLAQGATFLCSDNGVWLTERVPVGYLRPLND